MAQCLKVSCSQVRDLENGDYSRLPGETFVRGFIRSYCRLLDVSSQEAMLHYNSSLSPAKSDSESLREASPTFISRFRDRLFCRFDFFRSPWILFSTIFFLAVVGSGIGRFVWIHNHQDFSLSKVLPEDPVLTPTSQTNKTSENLSELDVRAFRQTWMIVHDSQGHAVFSGDLSTGKVYKLRALLPLSIVVGDISAISMTHNGRPLGHPKHITKSYSNNYVQFYLT